MGILKDTLYRRLKGLNSKPVGRPSIFTPEEEKDIADNIAKRQEWGVPLRYI